MKLHLPIVLRTLLLAVVIGMPSYVSAADRNYVVSGGSGTSDVVGSKGGAVYKKDGSISLSGYDSLQLTNNEVTQMGGAICATHKTGEEENINGYEIYIVNPNSVSLSDINNINISYNEVTEYGEEVYGSYKYGDAGAVYGNTTISNCGDIHFVDNVAYGTAGAVYGSMTITGCSNILFDCNTAGGSAGAIYGALSVTGAEALTFVNNRAGTMRTGGIGGAVWGNTTISNCVDILFENNTANSSAGAVRGTLSVTGSDALIIRDNHAGGVGGAVSGGVNIRGNDNVHFLSNSSDSIGGGIYASGNNISIVSNTDVQFDSNTATDGGALSIRNQSNTLISNNVGLFIQNNSAASLGGAVYTDSGSNTKIHGNGYVRLIGNHSNWGGFAYIGKDSSVSISDCYAELSIHGNTAVNQGGVAYVSSGNFSMSENSATNKISIYENTAGTGGFISADNSDIDLNGNTGVTIYLNKATIGSGGAIYIYGGNLSVQNNNNFTFQHNDAQANGGAIAAYSSELNFSANKTFGFINNKANYGGGIYSSSGNVSFIDNVSGTVFQGNEAVTSGGAIYSTGGKIEFISNSGTTSFRYNTAGKSGGVICGTTVIFSENNKLTFLENSAVEYGGAIYAGNLDINHNNQISLTGNKAELCGGAIYGRDGEINISDNAGNVSFSSNSAAEGGGAIYLREAALKMNSNSRELSFSRNTSGKGGGALFFNTSCSVEIKENAQVSFTDNTATIGGGAIHSGTSQVLISGTTGSVVFSGNTAEEYGGAIINSFGSFSMVSNNNISFVSNSAPMGGAIYGARGSFSVKDNTGEISFSSNSAQNAGGAIYMWGNTTELTELLFAGNNGGILFNDNEANMGGAIYSSDILTAFTSNKMGVSFQNNTAVTDGGAIYSTGGEYQFISNSGTMSFQCNTAGRSGGAIYASNVIFSENEKVSFVGNTAGEYGGAISPGILNINNNQEVSFAGNKAELLGGAIYGRSGEINISDNIGNIAFSGNSSTNDGGAIYLRESVLKMNSNSGELSFSKNSSGEDGGALVFNTSCSVEINENAQVSFTDNSATIGGGAIDSSSSQVLMNGTTGLVIFSGNTAEQGGAIINSFGSFSMVGNNDISFTDNSASMGGAIYSWGGSSVSMKDNTGEISFSSNSATSTGGAIYMWGDATELSIRNNQSVVFEKNYEHSGSSYQLRSIYADNSIIKLSAAKNSSIVFRDSVYINSSHAVEFNGNYVDSENAEHIQNGDIVFTGATTETDLLAVKGTAGTADEILNSRTNIITSANLYGGRLRIEAGAILEVNQITVADNSDATLMLKDGTIKGGVTIGATGTLSLTGENIISLENRNLTMADGSCLRMELGAVNMDGNAVLSTTGTLNMDYITFVLADSEYLETGKYKLLTRTEGTDYDISGWSLQGAAANQLTWENGTLYYTGGHDWNHVVKGGDEVQDSYTGNLIVKDGSVTLDSSVTVNAVDGVEKTGHLVVDKEANLTVTAESSVRAEVIVKDGSLHNEGSMEDSITLMGGKVSGIGVFAGIDMTGGKLVVGNSPGMQRYTDTVNLSGGTVVFSVAGAEAASAGNSGWGSGTYSTLDMQGNILTFGEDVTIEVAFGGEGLVSVLTATDANPYTLQMELAQNVGNAAAYTQEVLKALASQTTFVVTEETSGIAGCITLAPGQSLADIVKSYSYSMSGDTLVLSVTLAGNGKGVHAVPEPTTATLSLLALAALAARRRRK